MLSRDPALPSDSLFNTPEDARDLATYLVKMFGERAGERAQNLVTGLQRLGDIGEDYCLHLLDEVELLLELDVELRPPLNS